MTAFNHTFRRRLIGASLASLMLGGFAQPAFAQDEPAAESDTDEGTILVTANRREEDIQDVSVSVATIAADQIQTIFDTGADTTALAARVPGLFVESSNGRAAPRFYIRGLGNTDFDLAASQPVSVVMDDVVMENVTLKSFPIFDVQQIEVLRGPQGTLFGRNTPAGIVKIDTVKPSFDTNARASIGFGSLGTMVVDAGVGAPIGDNVAGRISFMFQSRNDFVDNGYTGEQDKYGGYVDLAVRGQLLFDSHDGFSVLASGQYRKLDGTSTLFRANILGPSNNELNGNYKRRTVYYDAGGGNEANYKMYGGTLKADYEFEGATLTSITATYHSEGSSRGDIDGGYGASFLPFMGPGFIPFPSDTKDSIDLDQFTQEVRLASDGDGAFTWQVGGFYFDSDFTVLTEGFTFPPPVEVRHQNESWALFGQVGAQLADSVKVTAGLRYTDDQKDFSVVSGSGPNDRSVGDSRLSWDLSAMFDVSSDASLFARVASGFRAPTIQGRDVAFFSPPSIATSEKIMSYELGWKSLLADRRVRLNGAIYYYTVTDPQFSAVGGAANLVQLVNANKGEGYGFELDSSFDVSDNFVVTAGVSYNHTEIKDDTLLVGICAQCTVLDPLVNVGGTNRALIDGNPFPNAPQWIGDVTARWSTPAGPNGEVFIFTDWSYQGKTSFFLYDSAEFVTDGQFEGGLRVGYATNNGMWEVAAFVRNITNEDNVKGGIDFNNNTAFVNDPRVIGVSARFNY
ncbi:TonB-dependent receptor [Altererythrobacter salegens]|uniref:TonB-dependent receptor n=1 Tax=Croceibacterium salegens TaxID=1737568 RepID=A0A6I4STU6_9SPHN|nr:TonB-dependent receptor [Croceibacterium salegens]MXO58326.1 TonB-dependent receptor [Croceibacterium salegens]